MKEVVKVSSLTKIYGDRVKVGPISLTIRENEVFGLVGPNGSGKTTTLRAVLGLLRPTSGEVKVFGLSPFAVPQKVNHRIGYSPEIPVFPPFFSAEKLLKTTCVMKGITGKAADQQVKQILELTGLVNHSHRKVGNFSKGMIQRLSIGQALVGDPPLLVLDEPMLGVDPVGRAHIRDVLVELKKQGKTILFSSHELYEVERLSDRIGMIYLGRTVLEEDVGKLRTSKKAVAVTLSRPVEKILLSALQEIEGVSEIIADGTTLKITWEGNMDPREKIAEKIVASGRGLLEMRMVERSLEDIFIAKVKEGVDG
ncbi:MAG: ABC transporter ATP-binding protein [Candidatus Caldarchaeum sp.]|nr:ABC transporter ATP-binding protein [Candidatus Caldarchaeum sp.]MDW8435269.1 ABC transporter ATP-binding protein [Candidatus Caldarchaeum sp.]